MQHYICYSYHISSGMPKTLIEKNIRTTGSLVRLPVNQ